MAAEEKGRYYFINRMDSLIRNAQDYRVGHKEFWKNWLKEAFIILEEMAKSNWLVDRYSGEVVPIDRIVRYVSKIIVKEGFTDCIHERYPYDVAQELGFYHLVHHTDKEFVKKLEQNAIRNFQEVENLNSSPVAIEPEKVEPEKPKLAKIARVLRKMADMFDADIGQGIFTEEWDGKVANALNQYCDGRWKVPDEWKLEVKDMIAADEETLSNIGNIYLYQKLKQLEAKYGPAVVDKLDFTGKWSSKIKHKPEKELNLILAPKNK